MLPRAALIARGALISVRPASSTALQQLQKTKRHYATQGKPKSATGEFYKTFTRPVAKTLLLALLTYQIIYWGWAKLEVDEIKEERTAEIAQLEAQMQLLQAAAAEKEKKALEVKESATAVVKKKGWWPF